MGVTGTSTVSVAWLRWDQSLLHPARGRKYRGLEQAVMLGLSFEGCFHCLLPPECGVLQIKPGPPLESRSHLHSLLQVANNTKLQCVLKVFYEFIYIYTYSQNI